jgi:hypothetical protein
VSFLSKFIDQKSKDYRFGGKPLAMLYDAYRRIARLRIQTGILSPLPELYFYQLLKRAHLH